MCAEWMTINNQRGYCLVNCRRLDLFMVQSRDVVNIILKSLNIPLNGWYDLTLDRTGWYQQYTRGISQATNSNPGVQCVVGVFNCMCGCSFCRQGGLTRHSRFCTGQPTVARSHFKCSCGRTFQHQGDLTRHSKFC